MKTKLSSKEILLLSSTLFGLFFGAGNLIFPVQLGQLAGANLIPAIIGFLITGIGLPLLAVTAMGLTNSRDVLEMARPVSKTYAKIFTILLYLCIGPFFAIPRLAMTSYEIGIVPFIQADQYDLFLAIFSVLFFIGVWWFSQNPSKILDYVGKFLNPAFLLLLSILFILSILNPMGDPMATAVDTQYQSPLTKGFLEGYNTLDALAGLAFGILVIAAVKQFGVTQPKHIAREVFKAGVLATLMMGIIYSLLAYTGASSVATIGLQENGGLGLGLISQHYFGHYGSILVSLIIFLACFKTSIGLVMACSESFHELFPAVSYKALTVIISVIPTILANIGLSRFIQYTLPILMFIYPLTMTLILLQFLKVLLDRHFPQIAFYWVTGLTLVAATIDAVNALPDPFKKQPWAQTLIQLGKDYLPFFKFGMGWILPAMIGLIIAYIIAAFRPKSGRTA